MTWRGEATSKRSVALSIVAYYPPQPDDDDDESPPFNLKTLSIIDLIASHHICRFFVFFFIGTTFQQKSLLYRI